MTGKARLVPNAISDAATATATSQASPPAHLLNMLREEVWHSEARVADSELPVQVITIDIDPAFIDTLVLDRHNLTGTGTLQARLLRSGVEQYDSGPRPGGIPIPAGIWRPGIDAIGATYNEKLSVKTGVVTLDTPVFCDQIEFTLTDPTNDQLEAGRVLAGLALLFDNNISWGGALTLVDETEHVRTVGGTSRALAGNTYRRQVLSYDWLTANDRARLLTELQYASVPLFLSVYPGAENAMQEIAHQFIGRRTSNHSVAINNALFGSASLTVEEI